MSRQPPRFSVVGGSLQGDPILVDAAEAMHMRVRRVEAGDLIHLFDDTGAEVEAELIAIDAGGARARLIRSIVGIVEPALRCTLVQVVPVKLQRMDTIVRQASELGVAEICPVIAARSQIPRGGLSVVERRCRRWRQLATAATKQCGRATVAIIRGAVGFDQVDWSELAKPLIVLDPRASYSLIELLQDPMPPAATLIVGPEGGIATEELRFLRNAGAACVRLGPRMMRADTAGMAALSVVMAAWGDLN